MQMMCLRDHGLRVDLTHVVSAVSLPDIPQRQRPGLVSLGDCDPVVLRDDVVTNC